MSGRRPSHPESQQRGRNVPGIDTSSTAPNLRTQFASDTADASLPSPNPQHAFRVPESPTTETTAKGAKVAIPRLKRNIDASGEGPSRAGGRHRVNHACEPCRHRKTKCSGERPVCRHCEDFKISCYYADGKRDRVKKQFGSMAEKVLDYEKLLKDLQGRVGEADARLIKTTLEKEATYDFDDVSVGNTTIRSVEAVPEGEESGAESDASAGAGSTGALDRTDEDFTRDSARETGFMGKNSEVTWLQRLKHENLHEDDGTEPRRMSGKKHPGDTTVPVQESDVGLKVSDTSYHLDDFAISTFEHVEPFEYPTRDVAQQLFNAYMARVHPTFPIVGKVNLTAQFNKFTAGKSQQPPNKWLAIINMIFAISAKYAHLIQADWRGDERDHLIYFTRARLLSVGTDALFQHPDLQDIQIVSLMALYFMCISQINRAWNVIGLGVRWATSLGLNLRNESTDLKNSLKEIRYRLWWAMYSLEHRLCCMTGRVNCVLDDHCTTPLPVPVEEAAFESGEGAKMLSIENQQGPRAPGVNSTPGSNRGSNTSSTSRSRSQTKATPQESRSPSSATTNANLLWAKDVAPNMSLYFLHLVQLTRLTQKIFHKLYNPSAIEGTWSDIQAVIGELDEQLEAWYRALPAVLDFRRQQRDREFYDCRLSLGFFYYSTKTVVHRPCLCRLDRKIPHQSNKSLAFNRNSATTCVESAREIMRLVPDEPNAVGLNKVGPWWSILHWLVQASTILMLELSFRVHHMPEEAEGILDDAKKGVRWLHALGEENISARRAWSLCDTMLREAAAKIGREVNDLPRYQPGHSPPQHDAPMGGVSQPGFGGMISQPSFVTSGMPSMYNPTVTASHGGFNTLMHFDQFTPFDPGMQFSMNYQSGNDADLAFMSSAFHEGAEGQGQQRPTRSPGSST